jgi:hypothetical protein
LLLTIFIVPPLARSASVEVANLDFPFEPTSGGGVFLVIIIVVGFAAWNTGNNLLFLVFSLLVRRCLSVGCGARFVARPDGVGAFSGSHLCGGSGAGDRDVAQHETSVAVVFDLVEGAWAGMRSSATRALSGYAKRLLAYFSYVPHHAAAEQRVEQLFPSAGTC